MSKPPVHRLVVSSTAPSVCRVRSGKKPVKALSGKSRKFGGTKRGCGPVSGGVLPKPSKSCLSPVRLSLLSMVDSSEYPVVDHAGHVGVALDLVSGVEVPALG